MATPIYQFTQLPQGSSKSAANARAHRARAEGEPPSVGVIYNPRSHGNKGVDFDCDINPQVHISKPGDRSDLPEALAEFAATGIDLLVINGGDGTVRDVLTHGIDIFGDDWPAIAVLPKGKTNALTVDLGVPGDWSLQKAIDAFEHGSRVVRRPLQVTSLNDGPVSRVLGFIFGAGAFTTAINAGQGAHRLGAFNSTVVGVTAAWGVLQWALGSRANPWRRGAKMTIKLGSSEVPMEHSGVGDPQWRQILLASTLETMPAGIKPFGDLKKGLKLAVTDQISRKSAIDLFRMIRGHTPAGARERGFHQLSTPQFKLEIEDSFILDGEAFPAGEYRIGQGPELEFIRP
ncbi:hypothetical protein CD351_02560 [Erythrobacter sp. KY5]|uniref:diacylglycerol/lipid kinase family protein n=1 Tax=Erythrobacter sp. KY5 TaxID=2011159 RepID=UPI000DBF184C|nr:acylglycerol kinase family protein [Erythrobacter sp. KY5]AWW73305.1 hypothetical protein CD351_02560 [Erythrobacter sp. KY5]